MPLPVCPWEEMRALQVLPSVQSWGHIHGSAHELLPKDEVGLLHIAIINLPQLDGFCLALSYHSAVLVGAECLSLNIVAVNVKNV